MTSVLSSFATAPLHRFWVFSDLQQSDPANARKCMHAGVDDFLSLALHVDAVCYLGDSTEGCDLGHLSAMADMQVEELGRVDAPIYYVMGNHEFDFHRHAESSEALTIPMRDRVLREPQWHTTRSPLDWMLRADFGDLSLVLLSDRCDPADRTWVTSHCNVRAVGDAPVPDHDFEADAAAVRAEMESIDVPFFTLSHYAFPGGNRDDEGGLQEKLLPLPLNAVAHFYGHSHFGDAIWGKKNLYRQVSTVNWSTVTQFDIASLEDIRSDAIRSAVVEWYGGRSFGVFFRNHSGRAWSKAVLENVPPKA